MFSIKHLYHINSSKAKVYDAIRKPENIANWWTSQTEGDGDSGGEITVRFGSKSEMKLKVKKLIKNEFINWFCIEGPEDWLNTEVSFRLDENDNKTRIRFEHSGWSVQDDLYAAISFTWGRYLESLRQFCQTGKGEAFGSPGYRT